MNEPVVPAKKGSSNPTFAKKKKKKILSSENMFIQICCCCFVGTSGRDKSGQKKIGRKMKKGDPETENLVTSTEETPITDSHSHTPLSSHNLLNRLEEIATKGNNPEEIPQGRKSSLTVPSTVNAGNSTATIGEA